MPRKNGRPRGDKRSEAEVERRRMLVYRLYVRGTPPAEIVKILVREGFAQRTVERDLQEVKVWIGQEFRAERERLMAENLAEIQEMRQEAWRIVSAGGSTNQDHFRRLGGLDRIMKLQVMRNMLVGVSQAPPQTSPTDQAIDDLASTILTWPNREERKLLLKLVSKLRNEEKTGTSNEPSGVAQS